MPQQILTTLENNFVGGLKTENNPLSFPENACTDTDNCIFSILGDTRRRPGFDLEQSFSTFSIPTINYAMCSYKWNNAGGDGETQILVEQVGPALYFYRSSSATEASPLSTTKLASTIDMLPFDVGVNLVDVECQFSDGNGYLFVYHPALNPFYCTYSAGVVTAHAINIQIRDFTGALDNLPINQRPGTLSAQHQYNLSNQGWTQGSEWIATDTTTTTAVNNGVHTFTIAAGLPITNGDNVHIFGTVTTYGFPQDPSVPVMTASVTNYVGTTLTVNVYSFLSGVIGNMVGSVNPITISPTNNGYINTWFADIGNYPSNADVWWKFKDNTDAFNPGVTNVSVTLGTGPAPKGHYILLAFDQQRDLISGVAGLTDVTTLVRPKTGTWFQGRAWYAGVDAAQAASGDQSHYSWSENIYFSQVVENVSQLGYCYQNNDPTSQDFFDLLPTDGGVIRIQGCGSVYKLFPVQNGLLVFAANGIWFITGSQGIGFTANDYTVTKISAVQSISGTSFVNILGWPVFWNEEGIYTVSPAQQGGGLTVDNLCTNSILSFYSEIPEISKRFVRGDYNPLNYVITWVYRSTNETNISDRYNYNRALNVNTSSKAFYPYTIGGAGTIHDVKYISSPGGSNAPDPTFKYFTTYLSGTLLTFSEERDVTNWVDFKSVDSIGANYESFFVTGYKIHGQALYKFQPMYINMFSDGETATAYKIQGIWDFAGDPNSGKYSAIQLITNALTRMNIIYRRHKFRGRGLALQMKVTSVNGMPFNIIGWSTVESRNAGV